jgi:hypothetical protein
LRSRGLAEPARSGSDRRDDRPRARILWEKIEMLGGIDDRDGRRTDRRTIDAVKQLQDTAILHATIDRGVASEDHVIEDDRDAFPDPLREMDVEVTHVADHHGVHPWKTSSSSSQSHPRPEDADPENGNEPRALQQTDPERGVEPERLVALENLVAMRLEAFTQHFDTRLAVSLVCAETKYPHGRLAAAR